MCAADESQHQQQVVVWMVAPTDRQPESVGQSDLLLAGQLSPIAFIITSAIIIIVIIIIIIVVVVAAVALDTNARFLGEMLIAC